jgi:soluble lytic murein transglycosylase-like protein
MIALEVIALYNVLENKIMRTCFKSVLAAGLAAVALCGASPEPARRARLVVRPDVQTGRLVRGVAVAPRVIPERVIAPVTPPSTESVPRPSGALHDVVDQIARNHALDPDLVHSVIRVESNYNPSAVSPKGALGIMQLVPSTARRFGVSNVFNPAQNIEGGVRYLKHLLELFNGNYPLALAAYNAGEAAVFRYGRIPPYPETQSYVYQVGKKWGEARRAAARARVSEAKPEPRPNVIREVVESDGRISYVNR